MLLAFWGIQTLNLNPSMVGNTTKLWNQIRALLNTNAELWHKFYWQGFKHGFEVLRESHRFDNTEVPDRDFSLLLFLFIPSSLQVILEYQPHKNIFYLFTWNWFLSSYLFHLCISKHKYDKVLICFLFFL